MRACLLGHGDCLFKSVVPAHTRADRQIWLDTIGKINDFIDKLNDPDFDLSHVDYIMISEPISDLHDIIAFFSGLRDRLPDHAKIIYTSYDYFCTPIFKLGFAQTQRIAVLSRGGSRILHSDVRVRPDHPTEYATDIGSESRWDGLPK